MSQRALLRGGCPGGRGGNGGLGGAGGGAIQISAAVAINITGTLNVAGGGGSGGPAGGIVSALGGGGGGSGGAVILESPILSFINGTVNAGGGSGAEGGCWHSNGEHGFNGPPHQEIPVLGGGVDAGGTDAGGNGGNGGVNARAPTAGAKGNTIEELLPDLTIAIVDEGGGGGGGASMGIVRFRQPGVDECIQPPPFPEFVTVAQRVNASGQPCP